MDFLSLIAVVLILLITLYLATQGLVSAFLALVTATFSSVLAMGLMEAGEGIVGGYRPAYARGVTFLLLFLLAFSATRIGADIAVPKNIKLPMWVDRLAGGVVGLFAALVVVGTTILGVEMMPVGRVVLGFDRFRGDRVMQGDNPGTVATPMGVWLGPDRFVLALWDGASGRSLGGAQAWGQVHPDLSVESYGYRNYVEDGATRVVPADLFTVSKSWTSADPRDVQGLGINIDAGKRIVVVRTEVKKGDKEPHVTVDPDGEYFRITATQVRLVAEQSGTGRARQHYPIGYLVKGRRFEALPLDSGHLIDDYNRDGAVVEDWVFEINDDERATWIEMKELARAPLTGVVVDVRDPSVKDAERTAASAPAPANRYPQVAYKSESSQLTVNLRVSLGTITEARVYVLMPSIAQKEIAGEVRAAYNKAVSISDGTLNWPNQPQPGVPSASEFRGGLNVGQNILNTPDAPVGWSQVMRMLLLGQMTTDGAQNLASLPRYIADTLDPIWRRPPTVMRASSDVVDASGKLELTKIPNTRLTIFATAKTDKAFYVWVEDQDFTANSHPERTLSSDQAFFKIELP